MCVHGSIQRMCVVLEENRPSILDDLIDDGDQGTLDDGHPQPQYPPLCAGTSGQVSIVVW